MPTKVLCKDCGDICFSRRKHPRCKPCDLVIRRENVEQEKRSYQREHAMKKKYGIDNDGFDCLWIAFKGKCGICEQQLSMPLPQRGQPRNVVVIDHDHESGNIRGLLCNSCNKAIGLLNDDPKLCKRAQIWLNYGENKHA